MPILEKIAGVFAAKAGDGAAKIIDAVGQFFNTPEERAEFELRRGELEYKVRQEINRSNEAALNEVAEVVKAQEENITKRWHADMSSDSWLTKNVRPLTLVALLTALFVFASLSATQHNIDEAWIELIKSWGFLVIVAYFGSRGVEKVMEIRQDNKKSEHP